MVSYFTKFLLYAYLFASSTFSHSFEELGALLGIPPQKVLDFEFLTCYEEFHLFMLLHLERVL